MKASFKRIIKNTYNNARKSIFFMLKIITPVTFIVMLLQYLDVIKYIIFIFKPLMALFGLPGDACLVIITGSLLNNYGAIAVMATMSFTVKEVTIIAVMLLFAHSLIVESAIMKGLHVSIIKQLFIRFASAISSGILLNLFIGTKYSELAYETIIKETNIPQLSKATFLLWLKDLLQNYFLTILNTTITLIIIITGLLLGLEILKEFKILDKVNNILYKLTKYLGFSKHAQSSLIVGVFIGITYGASTILINYKEGKMNTKDLKLVTTFLLLCHALIEDVLLFVNTGAITWIIIAYKLSFTILIIMLYNIYLTAKQKQR